MPMASDEHASERITGCMRVNTLSDVADKVAIAAAVGDIRPQLTGVRIELDGSRATFAASDGFRLAIYETTLERAIEEPICCTIPTKAIQEVARLSQGQIEPIEVSYSPRRARMFCMLDQPR